MVVDFSLPTTAGDTRSISSLRPRTVFIMAESRAHLKTNEPLKAGIKHLTEKQPSIAAKIDLVVVALLHKEPLIAKPIAEAFAKTAAQQAGLDCIWLDWTGESLKRLGVPIAASVPAYALLDRDGNVRWGKFGVVSADDQRALLDTLMGLP